jgi:hypothetical protein
VKPAIHHSLFDQAIHPSIVEQIVDVRLAHTGADACHDFVVQAILEALHRFAQNACSTSPLIAHEFGALHRDQRSHIAKLSQSLRDFVRNEVAVREYLEVGIRMGGEDIEQLFVQEWLASENTEERVPHRLGFVQGAVHGVQFNFRLLARDIDPTPLASQIAGVDDRQIKKGREKLASLQSTLVLDHAP